VAEDRQFLVLRDLTLDLCDSNLLPAITTPPSLDLAHLRTALWFDADARIARFVTKELGLPV
jgi:hypothetical protein